LAKNENLFSRLGQLFRSGPVIKRRVRKIDGAGTETADSAFQNFKKTQSYVYSTAMSAYGTYDRMARYSDFQEMEYTPEIASALDIYAEETAPYDDKGRVLHVYSENPTIQKILEDLFFDTLNIDFNLTSWTRNLVKYGDFFLFNDVDPKYGIINAYPMPVNEVEREEGFDMRDPLAVRYRWVTQGNQVLENWQVSHFRLLGNDAFLPYGSSVLESARRIWRQLILIEDAMLVYRIVRSPDRRVFYVDVGNIPPEEIPNYMEQVQTSLKKSQVIDKSTGRVDLRYNPMSVDEDYFIPVRGSETGTKIDTLAGGTNSAAVEDVQYIQKKLFSALKIPKAYLGYDEGLGAKATLSQEDIRFSRTINRIQRTVISELNKIAIIHLYSHGFEGEDMLDFQLSLTNPSTVAQQQKLELYRTRFEIANSALGIAGLIDRNWVRKNVFSMTDDEIAAIEKGKLFDKETDLRIEAVKLSEKTENDISTEVGIDFTLPPSGDTTLPGGEAPPGAGPEEPGGGVEASPENLTAGDRRLGGLISEPMNLSMLDDNSPIRAQSAVDRFRHLEVSKKKGETDDAYNRRRRTRSDLIGKDTDHARLVSHDSKNRSDSITHPFGHPKDLKNPFAGKMTEDEAFINNFLNEKTVVHDKMTASVRSALKNLEKRIPSNRKGVLISESNTSEDMDD